MTVNIMIAVVVSTTLLLVVMGLVYVVTIVAVVQRRWSKQHVYEDANSTRGVRLQEANTLESTTYCDPTNLDGNHTPEHHEPHPLHMPHTNTTSDNGDGISMQNCPAYQSIEDTLTSGDYANL